MFSYVAMLFLTLVGASTELEKDRCVVRENDPFEMTCNPKLENITTVRWKYISTQDNSSDTIFDSHPGKSLKTGFEVSCEPRETFISTCILKLVQAKKDDSGKYICYVGTRNAVTESNLTPINEIELLVRGPKYKTTVVNNGDSVILPCEHNITNLTRARWSHVSLQGVMTYQLYYMDWKEATSNNYEGLCKSHQLSCNLKILQANKESAGRYICMVGEPLEFEEKYGLFQMTFYIEVELVTGELTCNENMDRDLTLLGENDCYGIEADVLNLKCSFNYFGNINYNILHLRWIEKYKFNSLEKKLNSSLINHEVIDETNKISIQTNLSVAYEMQNSIFRCVVDDTFLRPCQLQKFRTQYVKNTTNRLPPMHSNDLHNIKCSANKSSYVQCSYYWVHEIGGATVENPYAILPVENMNSPGNYTCIAECRLGKGECIIKAMEFEVIQGLETVVTPASDAQDSLRSIWITIGVLGGVIIIILLITFFNCAMRVSTENQNDESTKQRLGLNLLAADECIPPPFYAENPNLWFGKVESLFRTQGIQEEIQKYSYALKNIPLHISEKVQDFRSNTSYTQLKEALLQLFDTKNVTSVV